MTDGSQLFVEVTAPASGGTGIGSVVNVQVLVIRHRHRLIGAGGHGR